MKTKQADIPYCGVNQERIKAATPTLNEGVLGHLIDFIRDRYEIHTKKDVQGLPAPWTTNRIFLEGKFTNVRREHDRQTINYTSISKQCTNEFELFWNTVLFRMFNVHWPFSGKPFDIYRLGEKSYQEEIRARFELLESEGKPIFTNAFNTGGLKQSLAIPESDDKSLCYSQRNPDHMIELEDGSTVSYRENLPKLKSGELKSPIFEPNMGMRIIRYIGFVANGSMKDLHKRVFNAPDQQISCKAIQEIRGVSFFLGYQMWVDLTYHDMFKFSENEYTVSGPGCIAGLNLLFGDRSGMNHDECLFWLRDHQASVFKEINFDELFYDLEPSDRCMNVMSLENCFCELGKYIRAVEAIERGEKPRFRVSTSRLVSGTGQAKEISLNSLW